MVTESLSLSLIQIAVVSVCSDITTFTLACMSSAPLAYDDSTTLSACTLQLSITESVIDEYNAKRDPEHRA
jgi:hypothetical protein